MVRDFYYRKKIAERKKFRPPASSSGQDRVFFTVKGRVFEHPEHVFTRNLR